MALITEIESHRKIIKDIESSVRGFNKSQIFQRPETFEGQYGEMKANIMLAVRHLEDARMRLGKVIQYSGDGESLYDKRTAS